MFNSPTKEDANNTNLKDATCEMADNLHNAANNAGRKVRSMVNNTSHNIAHASEYAGTEIRNNPVRSSIIALGVGVLLGCLLRR
jgi:ElaB/YqjD/DUF883 family membrane-anchored ribosome-binding protein